MTQEFTATVPEAGDAPDSATRKVRFAELLREGVPTARALVEAGYAFSSDNSRRALVSKLLRDPEVNRIASPEPQGVEEFAARVWQMQLVAPPGVARSNLLLLYAKLKGYMGKVAKSDALTAGALDEELPEFAE